MRKLLQYTTCPFDTEHGLNKTAELEQEGILVDSIPEPEE